MSAISMRRAKPALGVWGVPGALGALGVSLAILLASCATVPGHEPAQRVAVAAVNLGLDGTAVGPAPTDWWKSFGDGQLDQIITQALTDNPGLEQAQSRLRAAQAQSSLARAAQYPGLKLSGGETRLKIPSGFPPALDAGHSVWAGDLGASLAWDLDVWGHQAATLAQANSLQRAAGLEIDSARLMVSGAVVQAYIDLYRSYVLADIAERARSQRSNILEIARKRVAAGLDTRVELREAEGALPQAQVALLQAQSAQALAKHQLAALEGRAADGYPGMTRPQLDLNAGVPLPSALPINLLARRPDVIAARARIDAADSQKRAAKAAFYPTVSLKAFAGFASFSLQDLLGAGSFGYGAGPTLSLPLFDAGRLRAQYRGAEAELDSAVADYDDTVVRAVRQAADQLTLIDTLTQELVQQQQALTAAEEAYRLAEERYRAGLAGYLTVLNVETEVLNERRQQLDLSVSLALARVTLLLAVGGSFPGLNNPSLAAR